ncbi:MAG TPA: hypothetical protein VF483_07355, partial [Gemmatimonadaceae bacterium]
MRAARMDVYLPEPSRKLVLAKAKPAPRLLKSISANANVVHCSRELFNSPLKIPCGPEKRGANGSQTGFSVALKHPGADKYRRARLRKALARPVNSAISNAKATPPPCEMRRIAPESVAAQRKTQQGRGNAGPDFLESALWRREAILKRELLVRQRTDAPRSVSERPCVGAKRSRTSAKPM